MFALLDCVRYNEDFVKSRFCNFGRAEENRLLYRELHYCCGATVGSEQQHNQDLREIYNGRRILEFITFYHNALYLTTLFTRMHCI